MKKNCMIRSRLQRQPRRCNLALSLESLEHRHMLAANILASIDDSITASRPTDDIDMTVATPSGDAVTLMLEMTASNGGLDPAAPVVRAADGTIVTPLSSMDDAIGTDGITVVTLVAGDYTVDISAEGSTTGDYTLNISALGDVAAADAKVSSFERLQATAALIQAQGGGNHVTDLLFLQNGIDMSVSQYDTGFDANMNGMVDPFEVGIIEDNESAGRTVVTLQSDVEGPIVDRVRLVNDTGTSDSDTVTTDVRVSGRVQDESVITEVNVSLDGRTAEDVLDELGDLESSSGFFTLTRQILEDLAGGSLADGDHSVTISAIDEFGNETSSPATFNFVLIDNNVAPTTSGPVNANATEDLPFSFGMNSFFADANPGDPLTLSASGLPAWLSISPNGFLVGTPANADVGSELITVTATDSQGLDVTTTVTITIANTNDDPIITPIADRTVEEGVLFTLDLNSFISDPDVGDMLTVSADQADGIDGDGNPINLQPLPDWLTFDDTTLILSGTPDESDVGASFGVFVLAVDQAGLSDSELFQVTVQDVNDPPELVMDIPDDSVNEDQAYSLDLTNFFTDPDVNDSLSYEAELASGMALPSWLTLNLNTGLFSGTPGDDDVGVSLEIVATATDTFGESASDTFTLTVNNINDTPIVNDSTFRILPTDPAGTVVGTVDFSDADTGDVVTITATGGGGNFDVDSMTGVITVAAGANFTDGESFTLNVTGTDVDGASDTGVVTINVQLNDAPIAEDDDGFSVLDIETLDIDPSLLLSNDMDPDDDMIAISSVDNTSASGAEVTFDQGVILYNPRMVTELLALRPGESLIDTFTYTITDGTDFDTATVEVEVNGTDSVELILRTFNLSGNAITSVLPGDEFELRAFVQDVRPDPQGVFAPFMDVTYDANLASVSAGAEIVHSSTYGTVPVGDTSVPGLIDEVGGLDGFSPLGADEFEVFRIRMQADAMAGPGNVIQFQTDPADDRVQHSILVFLDDDPVPDEQIVFGGVSLSINAEGLIPPLSGTAPGTNFDNPMDTNVDSAVSPMDVLVVVNAIEMGSSDMYPDVNADGHISPLDALAVVNYLNGSMPQAPLSASESATEAAFDLVADNGPVSAAASEGVLAADGIDLVMESTSVAGGDSLVSSSRPMAWGAADESDVSAHQEDDDEEASAVDAIFGTLG
jgi:VCBS repeat-containing protein